MYSLYVMVPHLYHTCWRLLRDETKMVTEVARQLGNTAAVCHRCYVHPVVLGSYLDGSLLQTLALPNKKLERNLSNLHAEEVALLVFLQRRSAAEVKQSREAT